MLVTKHQTPSLPAAWSINKRLTTLTDQEAKDLLDARSDGNNGLHDPGRTGLHRTWFLAVAHLLCHRLERGIHLPDVDSSLLPRESPYDANHILRHAMFQVARLAGITPEFEVAPHGIDIDDEFAADVAEQFLRWLGDRQRWPQKRLELAWWLVTCGHAYLLADWDPKIGKKLQQGVNPFTKPGAPSEEVDISTYGEEDLESLRSLGGVVERHAGDLVKKIISPFQVLVPQDFRGRSICHDDCPWIVMQEEVSPGWIWQHYPEAGPHLRRDDLSGAAGSSYWRRAMALTNRFGFMGRDAGMTSSPAGESDMILLRTLIVPSSAWAPKGYVVRGTKMLLLDHGAHPMADAFDLTDSTWAHLRYPISEVRYSEVPGRYHGQGLVENLIGPQGAYNVAADQLIRQAERFGGPEILAPNDCKLSHQGDIWTYDPNKGTPTVIQAPVVGQAQQMVKEQSMQDMRLIAAQSDPSLGDSSGVRSGVGISLLQETDEVSINSSIMSLWVAYQDTSNRDLALTWRFWDQESLIQIAGEQRAGKVMAFKGSMLNGNVFVSVKPTSMRIQSRAAATELAQLLVSLGVLNPAIPDHAQAVLSAVQFKSVDHLFHNTQLNRDRARQENLMFQRPTVSIEGQVIWPDVDMHDDPMVHIAEHKNFKLTDAYERLAIPAKLAHTAHLMKHEQQLADILMSQQQMAASQPAAGGGGSQPREPGKASPPRDRNPTPGPQSMPQKSPA